jgi:hypothetical protein
VKETIGVWEIAQVPVENRQRNHHQHRGQNETSKRNARAAPTSQLKADVGHGIARVCARQALREREAFDKFSICDPAARLDYQRPYLCDDSQTTAETDRANFKE